MLSFHFLSMVSFHSLNIFIMVDLNLCPFGLTSGLPQRVSGDGSPLLVLTIFHISYACVIIFLQKTVHLKQYNDNLEFRLAIWNIICKSDSLPSPGFVTAVAVCCLLRDLSK